MLKRLLDTNNARALRLQLNNFSNSDQITAKNGKAMRRNQRKTAAKIS